MKNIYKFIIVGIASFGLAAVLFVFVLSENNSNSESVKEKPPSAGKPTQTPQPENKQMPKTIKKAKAQAEKYWDAVIYKDYVEKYEFMCNEVTDYVSEEAYIQRHKNSDNIGATDYELESAEMDGTVVRIRTKLFNLAYPDGAPGMTEMRYEDGAWCKVLEQDTIDWLKGKE